MNNFLEDGKVRFATLIFVVVFILGTITGLCLFIFKESQWRTNIQRDISDLRATVNEVKDLVQGSTSDGFTYTQMKTWVTRFKELNEDSPIKVPTLPMR